LVGGALQMDAYALVAAEEIFFSVQLHRLAMKSTIRVDFNLRSVRIVFCRC
jgi:hypothetical protein